MRGMLIAIARAVKNAMRSVVKAVLRGGQITWERVFKPTVESALDVADAVLSAPGAIAKGLVSGGPGEGNDPQSVQDVKRQTRLPSDVPGSTQRSRPRPDLEMPSTLTVGPDGLLYRREMTEREMEKAAADIRSADATYKQFIMASTDKDRARVDLSCFELKTEHWLRSLNAAERHRLRSSDPMEQRLHVYGGRNIAGVRQAPTLISPAAVDRMEAAAATAPRQSFQDRVLELRGRRERELDEEVERQLPPVLLAAC